MKFEPIIFIMKDGRQCMLRPPVEADAQQMIDFRIRTAGESDFLLNYPEELEGYTLEKQLAFVHRMEMSENDFMAVAVVDGKIAGTCQISFTGRIKLKHKANIGIAILKEFWGLGIGSKMFREMLAQAKERKDVLQVELEVIEGNERAMALYRKFGFEIVAQKPDAIRLKDGTMLKEITMMKKL